MVMDMVSLGLGSELGLGLGQGSTLTFKSTCPIGQVLEKVTCPHFSPVARITAQQNMGGGLTCHIVMSVGMNISYQPVALIVFITSSSEKSQNNRTGTHYSPQPDLVLYSYTG